MSIDRVKNTVCFVCLGVKPGGGNKVIFELCDIINKSAQMEYEIITIEGAPTSNTNYSFSKFNNLHSRCLGFNSSHPILLFCNLIFTFIYLGLFSHRYKAIMINSSLLAPIFGFVPSQNIYSYIQGDDYSIFDNRFSARSQFILDIYKWATKNIAYQMYGSRYLFNSKFTYEKFRATAARDLPVVNFILPGVDLELFNSLATSPAVPAKITVSAILRKQPSKRSVDFFSAMATIPADVRDRINFVGITNEDISNLDIPDSIPIARPNSDRELATLFHQTDIFIVTSQWEGFGLPGLEAMAGGCALISSDNGGCNEYAVDGVNCLLYEPGNVSDLADKIVFLLEDPDRRKSLSIEGLITAKKYSWQATFENLQKFLDL
jgi:glycosyltransferase involved in cell wall biosynthesis